MSIYQVYPITDNIVNSFRPTRLAIKELAGQFYFCKTTLEDFDSYTGSGVAWQKRIKKYGKENIKTLWVSDWYYDPYEIQKVALDFSRENQIVESKKWANLKPENGLDGGGCLSDDSKDLVRQYQNSKVSDGTHHLLGGEIQGKASRERVNNGTHNWSGPESNQKRIDEGTHNFLGMTREKHHRYDPTLYSFINVESGEVVTLTKRNFIAIKLNDDISQNGNLIAMINGRRKRIRGWELVK